MTRDQRIVAAGAVSGIILMVFVVWLLSTVIAPPRIPDKPADRIAFALPWAVLAGVPLFAMVIAIGNARFASEAIDPTLGKESHAMAINGRVADNTLQQFALFVVAMLSLATMLPAGRLSLIPAVSITFVLMRILFWIGYRIHPLYRAPGFSSTAYMNIFMFIAVFWLWLR